MDSEPTKPQINEEAENDESSESESEEEEKKWVYILVERIIESKNYENREKEIMEFLQDWIYSRIYNMEVSFGKRGATKDEKKKYERANEALEIMKG
jgi:hypothetical protein